MLKNSFFKTIAFILFVVLLNSCDKEYNVVGEDLIGDNNFTLKDTVYDIVAYNQKIGPVQSNNLEINALGIYDNPSFGTTTANFNTQVALAVVDPTFDDSAVITSVILTVPYFYDKTKTETNTTTGAKTYFLDSIYGPDLAKFKLRIYESGYYMRDLDPADQFLKPQKYYTNQNAEFAALKIGMPLNNSANKAQNDEFFFSPAELTVSTKDATTGVATETKSPPGMQLDLNKDFFTKKLITEAPAGVLKNNDLFKDYFRGLYFQVESLGSEANQAMIDFRKGSITVAYEETIDSKKVYKTLKINLSGNTVSLLNESNPNAEYTNATDPNNINHTTGDDNLYLKGGQGSMSILELFGVDNFGPDGVTGSKNGVPDALDIMRTKSLLINEANIVFYLNSAKMEKNATDAGKINYFPQRIYLYDFTNNQSLIDYAVDRSVASNIKNSKFIFGGYLTKNPAGDYCYKFRITNYIKSLIKNTDSTNVKLGVVVTEDINKATMYALKGPDPDPTYIPMTSVMNPLGAILFGGTDSEDVPSNKRLKLEIYYTKPN
ncbi:DUF4270 domain-containing protein [Flavobacterium sp. N3904]|uniref:DUF4270 domain-containing protein n=1 Tax=Flavobacterium sp. N3904 TaxID=2986835 RepID=UPI0022257243|nr:DUF4270 domain-containing protein [Flavobacterium sp. N3904]